MLLSASLVTAGALFASQEKVEKAEAAYDNRLHIVGSGTFGSWTAQGAVQMVSDGSSNTAKKTGQTIAADTQFKIAYIENGNIQWGWDSYGSASMDNKAYTFAQDESGNIKIKYDGTYNIYLTNNYKVYMSRDLTISFNANGGSVSPSSKTITQEYSGASGNAYGDLPTPTRSGYTFNGWFTSSSGGKEIKSTSSTYSLTENQTIFAQWTKNPTTRKIRVGSTDYNLTVNPEKDYEYTTTLSSVTAGTQLNYYEDSSLIATSAKAVGNNNMTSSKTVLVNATSVSVYVDINAKTIWLGGLPLGGFHMIINGSRLVHMSDGGEYEGYTQYKSEMIAFDVNDTIQTVDCGGTSSLPVVFTIVNIVQSGLGSNFTVDNGVLKCTTAVSARVFMKMRTDRNEIYFGDVEEYVTKAIDFASGFNAAISAKCSSTGATNVSQLASAWSGQVTLFTKLEEESRDYLKEITGEESPILATFLEKYMYVATKYKTQLGNNYNFLSKTIPSGSNFIPMTTIQTNTSTTIIVVVVVGVAAIAAGGYFLLRKKKEN